jgi:hypothetical protein
VDLQVLKAAGVTFAVSMLERVIEERARGNPASAAAIRAEVVKLVGDDLSKLKPGSQEAMRLKDVLVSQQARSQYLEVGFGPDAEVFTKAPVLSSVGTGMDAGVHPKSTWNNPEPEVVLVVSSRGKIVGATLGNDVNLRDFEGRSALLLSKAKDCPRGKSPRPLMPFSPPANSVTADRSGLRSDLIAIAPGVIACRSNIKQCSERLLANSREAMVLVSFNSPPRAPAKRIQEFNRRKARAPLPERLRYPMRGRTKSSSYVIDWTLRDRGGGCPRSLYF